MKAIAIVDGQLVWQEAPDPVAGPDEVSIRVYATAVNRADLSQRAGLYGPPPGKSLIVGLECAGVVEADAGPWKAGDRVCALLSGGGYAERAVAHVGHVLPIPDGLDFGDAAALPEVLATAWLNLWIEGGAKPGERIVLHAGASGVGTAAIQIAHAMGNPVLAIVGNETKRQACLALGADAAIDRHAGPWPAAVRAWAPDGVDLILDPVGGGTVADDLSLLATGGRVVVIGLMGGRTAEVDLGRLMTKRLSIRGSVLRARSDAEKSTIVHSLTEHVWPLVRAGRIRPIVPTRLPIAEANHAHALLASDQTIGKVVLTVTDVTSAVTGWTSEPRRGN